MSETVLRVERAATAVARWLALAAGFALLGLSIVTVADALLRKFLSRPIQGTFEASELVMAAVVFFGMPYTGLTDGHVAVDMLANRLPPRGRHVVLALTAAVCALVLALIAWEMGLLAAEYARTARTTITARIPVLPFIAPVTAAAWLAALAFLIQALAGLVRAAGPQAKGA